MRTSGEVTAVIRADPATIYEAVADVTRIGEFSPECHRARWQDDTAAAPVVGARFRGWNAAKWIRWSRECEVVVADPGREFAFRTIPTLLKRDSTVWSYRFAPVADGTEVVETYDITRLPPRPIVAMISRLLPHHLDMRPHMQRTLATLKTTLERQPSSSAPSQ
jgi:hypothetical protein